MTLEFDEASFSPGVYAANWQEAVRAAGVDLVHQKAVGPAYVDEMVQAIELSGPYCVVAPGIAVPHASAGALVRHPALAIVTLTEPVAFGHPQNDPVQVIVGFAAKTPRAHIRMLASLANVLDDTPDAAARLLAASTREAALDIIRGEA